MRPAKTCTVDDCEDFVHGDGLCSKHYKRQRKHGTTDDPRAPKPCAVDGCENQAEPGRKGWCSKHYTAWRRHGDPLAVTVIVGDDVARFWSKVSKDGPVPEHAPELGPCWPWTGDTDEQGYGIFSWVDDGHPKKTKAHRWLLGHLRSKPLSRVAGEEDACHRCDNPPCCNPGHLYVGTRAQNLADALERKRLWQQNVDECPQGHPLDGVKMQANGRTRRFCKTCARIGQRKHRTEDRKTCRNGHKLEGDNILLCKNGTRKCRTCDEARAAAASERARQRWADDPAGMTEAVRRGRWGA
jgi:hypothetical protein